MNTNYTVMTDSVRAAFSADNTAANKWANAANHVREYFGDAEELKKNKVQFCADTILLMIDKRHRDALELNIPRKGSKDDTEPAKNEAARKAKKDATATRDTMFMYVLKKAWPEYGKADDDGDDKPDATDSDKIRKAIAELVTRVQKKENLDFDVAAVVGFLNKAATAAAKKN